MGALASGLPATAPLSFVVSGSNGCVVSAGVLQLRTASGLVIDSQAPGAGGLVTFNKVAVPPGTAQLAALFSGPGACTDSSFQLPASAASAGAADGSGNIQIVVGCVASVTPTDIEFGALANGALAQPALQIVPTTNTVAPAGLGSAAVINGFDLARPYNALECSAIVQDTPPDIDAMPNTVDAGSITYSLNTLGGRFAILNNKSAVYGVACGQPTGAALGFEGCSGGRFVTGSSVVTPNPANIIEVGLAPGVALSSFGSLSAIAGLSGFSLTATYTRDPAISANVAAVPPGPESASATALLGVLTPTYQLNLTAAPSTIPARPQIATPGAASPNVGLVPGVQSSTITANLTTVGITAAGSILIGAPSTTTTVGTEPGTVTFVTNLGLFGDLAAQLATGKQTAAVACGQLPGYTPVYNPATFGFNTYSFASCQTATATLYGGGQAGQATVVATFVGSITGAQSQNAVAVALSPIASVIVLARGCNQVLTPDSLVPNTPISTYVYNYIIPSGSVAAVWQYNNALQMYQGLFFTNSSAPTVPNAVVGPDQSLIVCLASPTTVIIASPSASPTPAPTPNATPPVIVNN